MYFWCFDHFDGFLRTQKSPYVDSAQRETPGSVGVSHLVVTAETKQIFTKLLPRGESARHDNKVVSMHN